jgi:uncharacterized protein (DUF2384 family)
MASTRPRRARTVAASGGPLQTFSAESDRERLSPVAVKAVKNVATHWLLKGDEAAALLGVSPSTWDRMSAGKGEKSLSQDQLTRISAMVGLFKGLHILFADDMADRWVRLRNKGPLFNNRTPVEAMIEGGIPMMLDVRRHVDALRGGF